MTPLIDQLRALVGAETLGEDEDLLATGDTYAEKLAHSHGVLHSPAVQDAVDDMCASQTCVKRRRKVPYYIGLQVGWRVAHRLRGGGHD